MEHEHSTTHKQHLDTKAVISEKSKSILINGAIVLLPNCFGISKITSSFKAEISLKRGYLRYPCLFRFSNIGYSFHNSCTNTLFIDSVD